MGLFWASLGLLQALLLDLPFHHLTQARTFHHLHQQQQLHLQQQDLSSLSLSAQTAVAFSPHPELSCGG